jgi:hypothetical protein
MQQKTEAITTRITNRESRTDKTATAATDINRPEPARITGAKSKATEAQTSNHKQTNHKHSHISANLLLSYTVILADILIFKQAENNEDF